MVDHSNDGAVITNGWRGTYAIEDSALLLLNQLRQWIHCLFNYYKLTTFHKYSYLIRKLFKFKFYNNYEVELLH